MQVLFRFSQLCRDFSWRNRQCSFANRTVLHIVTFQNKEDSKLFSYQRQMQGDYAKRKYTRWGLAKNILCEQRQSKQLHMYVQGRVNISKNCVCILCGQSKRKSDCSFYWNDLTKTKNIIHFLKYKFHQLPKQPHQQCGPTFWLFYANNL